MSAYEQAIRHELDFWPGVDVQFGRRSKHREAVFHYRGATRFVVYPDTPSDSSRGHLNCLSDVRHQLVALGAERKAKRSKKRRRHRVIGHQMPRQPEWARRVEMAPVKPNPFEALSAIQFAQEPQRKGHLREAMKRLAGSVRRMVARCLKGIRP